MQNNTQTSLASLFMGVWRGLKIRLEKELSIPLSQCEVLRVVSEMENPSMSDLAERFKIAAPSVTTLVEPLVKEKFITRNADTKDRRQIRLALTKKGIDAKELVEEKRARAIEDLLSGLDQEDITHLTRILTKITATQS